MNLSGLKMRWINYAGYEIVLPNGKVVLIDPSLSMNLAEEEREQLAEKFYTNGCDYIIISHIHMDHINDIPTLLKKYNPKIFVGATSAYWLMQLYNISRDNIYPVFPNEAYELDGMRLQIFHGKHKFQNPNLKMLPKNEMEQIVGTYGSIEYMDYCLTTKENISIFVSGGGKPELVFQNLDDELKRCRPNILLRQTTSKWSPEEFAHIVDGWHAQIVFPIHQDGLARAAGMPLKVYFNRVNKELEKIGSYTRVMNADSHKWFTINTTISIEGEDNAKK